MIKADCFKKLKSVPIVATLIFSFIVLAGLVAQYVITEPSQTATYLDLDKQITDAKKLSLTMLADRSEVMASWSMGIIATFAFLFNYFKDKNIGITIKDYVIGVIVFLFSVISIFSSHAAFELMTRRLYYNEDPISDPNVYFLMQIQYFSLIISIVIFVGFALFLMHSETSDKN